MSKEHLFKETHVKEKSRQNSLIENNEIIWNCSNGVNNIKNKKLNFFIMY